MAIKLQLSEYLELGRAPGTRVEVLTLPPVAVTHAVELGTYGPFNRASRYFRLRNYGTTDLQFRIHKVQEVVSEAAAAAETEWLLSGDSIDFMLDSRAIPSDWCMSILSF